MNLAINIDRVAGGNSGVCATGFVFVDPATGQKVSGPLTSILAVRYSRGE